MPKPNPAGPDETRQRLIQATLDSLREDGFAGTSIRNIGGRAGMNSALVAYHFGNLQGLLLAALDANSEARIAAYRTALEGTSTPEEFMRTATLIYRTDVEEGNITVFSELLAGSLAHPELRTELLARTEPWLELVQASVDRVIAGSPLEGVVPTEPLAWALLAFYLGVNLFTHLDEDNERTAELFDFAERFAPLLTPVLEPGPVSGAVMKQLAKRAVRKR